MDYDTDYTYEVRAEAERMVRDGEGAPYDVYTEAHRRVQQRRRQKARERGQVEIAKLFGQESR